MSNAVIEHLKTLLIKGAGVKQIRVIAEEASADKRVYQALITLVQDPDVSTRMKSAWALAKASELNPDFAKPHISLLMDLMQTEKTGGVIREIYKTLACLTIPEKMEGLFIDISFAMLQSAESDLAVKYHAKTALTSYVKKYPELKNELIASLHAAAEAHSDAWKVQVMKSIARLEKSR